MKMAAFGDGLPKCTSASSVDLHLAGTTLPGLMLVAWVGMALVAFHSPTNVKHACAPLPAPCCCARSDKPLLLAVCLKEEGRDTQTFQEVINQVLSLGGWSG